MESTPDPRLTPTKLGKACAGLPLGTRPGALPSLMGLLIWGAEGDLSACLAGPGPSRGDLETHLRCVTPDIPRLRPASSGNEGSVGN